MKEIVNMKKINITKYKGNTHYNIHVIDSFGQEHHLGSFKLINLYLPNLERRAEEIWSNETKNVYDDSLDKAIQNCIELDNKAGRENGGLSVNI
jgi:hypothetical protein